MAESNPMRWVVLSLVAGGLFVLGLLAFIDRSVARAKADAKAAAEMSSRKLEARGTPLLEQASSVADSLLAFARAGRFIEAHELLAAPYRRAVPVDAFAKTYQASPLLAGARSVTLRELRRQSVGQAVTLEARGLMDSSAGTVPLSLVFMVEPPGPRILVLSLAGVPILQGVVPTAR